ncbi:MAG: helix-turn-helix domain-containing protein [Actinomycetota bacterium]
MSDERRDIGGFIREQRTLAELSVRRLADLAGVSNPYLSQIERGLRKPSAEILQQLAKALQVSAETMFIQAGILDEESVGPTPTLEAAIRSAPELNEEQRKALLGVYRSFVGTLPSEAADGGDAELEAGEGADDGAAEDDPAQDSPAEDSPADGGVETTSS